MFKFFTPAVPFEDGYLYSNQTEFVLGIYPNSTRNPFHAPFYGDRAECQIWCDKANELGFSWEVIEVEVDQAELDAYTEQYNAYIASIEAAIKAAIKANQ